MSNKCELKLQLISSAQEFCALKPKWQNILDDLDECPPFLTWEWMYTWWCVYSSNKTKLLIILFLDQDEIVAIAPFYIRFSYAPFLKKTIYCLGTGEQENMEVCSEYLDFICAPSYREQVCNKAIEFFTASIGIWDCLSFSRVLEDSALAKTFEPLCVSNNFLSKKKAIGLRHFINLPHCWDDYLKSIRSSMRRSIKVAQTKAYKYPDYKVTPVEDKKDLDRCMNDLINLHTKSWSLKGMPGAFASDEFCDFHHKTAELFLNKKMLSMMKISLSGEVVGVIYNFRIKSVVYYYQSGLNMGTFSSLKPGVLLHAEAIKASILDNKKMYDFMVGSSDSYKARYADGNSEMCNICVWNKSFRAFLLRKFALIPYFRRVK